MASPFVGTGPAMTASPNSVAEGPFISDSADGPDGRSGRGRHSMTGWCRAFDSRAAQGRVGVHQPRRDPHLVTALLLSVTASVPPADTVSPRPPYRNAVGGLRCRTSSSRLLALISM